VGVGGGGGRTGCELRARSPTPGRRRSAGSTPRHPVVTGPDPTPPLAPAPATGAPGRTLRRQTDARSSPPTLPPRTPSARPPSHPCTGQVYRIAARPRRASRGVPPPARQHRQSVRGSLRRRPTERLLTPRRHQYHPRPGVELRRPGGRGMRSTFAPGATSSGSHASPSVRPRPSTSRNRMSGPWPASSGATRTFPLDHRRASRTSLRANAYIGIIHYARRFWDRLIGPRPLVPQVPVNRVRSPRGSPAPRGVESAARNSPLAAPGPVRTSSQPSVSTR